MDNIELHLTDTIEYKELAKIVCCSVYHFQRMFSFISGVSLSEYNELNVINYKRIKISLYLKLPCKVSYRHYFIGKYAHLYF